MASEADIELNPIDFITFGTIGPKGRRTFYLQAGEGTQNISLTLEKQQTKALGEAIAELLDDLITRFPQGAEGNVRLAEWNMELRDPVDTFFRIGQIGLGYDELQNKVVLVAQELLVPDEDDEEGLTLNEPQPRIVRFWGSRAQFRALSIYASKLIDKGRADPKQNGRIIYYWT